MDNILKNILKDITNRTIQDLNNNSDLDYSLLGGDFGKILYLYYASSHGYCTQNIADDYLDLMLSSIREKPIISTYCNGIAGLCIGLKILEDVGYIEGVAENIGSFQKLLFNRVKEWLTYDLDFLHGAIGVGFYFIERAKIDKDAYSNVYSILNFLEDHAIKDKNGGIYWLYPDRNNYLKQNLSLSHGICSTALFVARAYGVMNENIGQNLCKRLLTGIGIYLLSKLMNPLCFGCYTPMLPELYKSRLGWCYGDIGTCIAFRAIGEITHNDQLLNLSREIAIFTALNRTNLKDNFVFDACLCHGTSGIAHFFKNCFYFYNESIFEDSFERWSNITVKMYDKINGEYMFGSYRFDDDRKHPCLSILEGDTGIGLMLMGEYSILNNILLYEY